MCKFFSFVSDPNKPIPERFMYFDWEIRERILAKELNYYHDSHTSIAHYYGYKGRKEDSLNKYEYNPLTKEFNVDQINGKDDRKEAEFWVREVDFKVIIPQLVIKPIINPLLLPIAIPTEEHEVLLKAWASVGDSVGDSIWDSIWDSVGASIWDSIWASVGDSVGAYLSSFFDIKYESDLSPAIKLWEAGLVPSFDVKTWRLHSGEDAKIVYEWKKS